MGINREHTKNSKKFGVVTKNSHFLMIQFGNLFSGLSISPPLVWLKSEANVFLDNVFSFFMSYVLAKVNQVKDTSLRFKYSNWI